MSGVRPPLNRSTVTGQCHARPFYRLERVADIYRAGVCVVPGAGMDIWVKTHFFAHAGDGINNPRTSSL